MTDRTLSTDMTPSGIELQTKIQELGATALIIKAESDALIAEKAALLSNNQALHSRLETECAELDNLNEAQANKIVELKVLNEELAGVLEGITDACEGMDEWPTYTERSRAVLAKHKAGAA